MTAEFLEVTRECGPKLRPQELENELLQVAAVATMWAACLMKIDEDKENDSANH